MLVHDWFTVKRDLHKKLELRRTSTGFQRNVNSNFIRWIVLCFNLWDNKVKLSIDSEDWCRTEIDCCVLPCAAQVLLFALVWLPYRQVLYRRPPKNWKGNKSVKPKRELGSSPAKFHSSALMVLTNVCMLGSPQLFVMDWLFSYLLCLIDFWWS